MSYSWKDFEIEATKYLQNKFSAYALFQQRGGSNSTESDIKVTTKKDNSVFYIECKESDAQSGQFVLNVDKSKNIFIFSPKNKTLPNKYSQNIIDYMNHNVSKFTSGNKKSMELDHTKICGGEQTFSNWIKYYYKNYKNVRYFLSKNKEGDFKLIDIDRIDDFFIIKAKYRMKKSGSSNPSKKYWNKIINEKFKNYDILIEGNKLSIKSYNTDNIPNNFDIEDKTFYLSKSKNGKMNIRQLSNTYHYNVIFDIHLK